jgi:hypothetical protein
VSDIQMIVLAVESAELAADLRNWMSEQGQPAQTLNSDQHMGSTEIVAIAVSSAAVARGALVLAREWVRARRMVIEVRYAKERTIRIEADADVDQIIEILKQSK